MFREPMSIVRRAEYYSESRELLLDALDDVMAMRKIIENVLNQIEKKKATEKG